MAQQQRWILPAALVGVGLLFLLRPRRAAAVALPPVEVTGMTPELEREYQQSLCPPDSRAMYVGTRWQCTPLEKQPLPAPPMQPRVQPQVCPPVCPAAEPPPVVEAAVKGITGLVRQLQERARAGTLADWHANGCGSY